MARYNKSNKGLTVGICVGSVALMIIAIAVIIFAAVSRGFTDFNYEAYFNYWGKGAPADVPIIDYENPDVAYGAHGYLVVHTADIEGAPVELTSQTRSINGKVSEVLTANVTPVNADVFKVIWKSSDTSKVVVTPIEGDKLSARLTCVARFNTPITITCEVHSTTILTATCTVDCLARMNENLDVSLYSRYVSFSEEIGISVADDTRPENCGGTVFGDYRVKEINLELTTKLLKRMSEILGESYIEGNASYSLDPGERVCQLSGIKSVFNFKSSIDDATLQQAFKQACYDIDDDEVIVYVVFEYVCDGKVYGTTSDYKVYTSFDESSYVIPAEEVTVTPNNPIIVPEG